MPSFGRDVTVPKVSFLIRMHRPTPLPHIARALAWAALCPLLALSATPAGPAWSQVGSAEAGMTHYFDPASVTAAGELRSVYRLASQSEGPQRDAMSNQTLWQVDCGSAQGRIVQMWWFQQPMALGLSLDVTFRTDTRWHPVAPDSPSQAVMALVCRH